MITDSSIMANTESTITVLEGQADPIVMVDYLIGPQGPSGNTILNGYIPPTNSIGDIGDIYLDLSSKKLYGPKSITGWSVGIDLGNSQGYVSVPFRYGDVYPKLLTVVPPNKIISKIDVIINTPFDNILTFEIGNRNGLVVFGNEQLDAFEKGLYQSCPVYEAQTPTSMFLTITANNVMSSGSGIVLIYIEETI